MRDAGCSEPSTPASPGPAASLSCSVPPASEKLLGGGIYRTPKLPGGFIVFLHQDFVLGY